MSVRGHLALCPLPVTYQKPITLVQTISWFHHGLSTSFNRQLKAMLDLSSYQIDGTSPHPPQP